MTCPQDRRSPRAAGSRGSSAGRSLGWVAAALALAACTDAGDPASEMQRAIRGSEQALETVLLGSELLWWADAPPTVTLRHGETCGCPCRERIGSGEIVLLDYALDGCVPDSGLVPDELLGHVTLTEHPTGHLAVPDGLEWERVSDSARTAVATDLAGGWKEDRLTLAGSLLWNDTWAELDVRVARSADGVEVAGTVRGSEAWVDLDAVQLRFADLRGRCPRATAGTIRVWAPGEPVRLTPAADGRVVASWKGESSLPTDPCDVQ